MLIYIIRNTINKKVYIGQTIKTLKERWDNYYKEYKYRKKVGIRIIILAMRKHGFENFYCEVLKDNIKTLADLNRWEIYYINKYNSTNKNFGYNIEHGGNSKGKHSKLVREKISKAQLGKKNHMYGKRGKDNPSSKPIIDLTTGEIFDSATSICEAYNYPLHTVTKICACARGDRWFTNHKTYRYLDSNNPPIIVNLPKTRKTTYIYYDKTNNITYFSLTELSHKHNLPRADINYYILAKQKIDGILYERSEEKVTYECYTKGRDYKYILPQYTYLVNTVLSPPKIIEGKV